MEKRVKQVLGRGSHAEFFKEVIKSGITLITKQESSISSDVTEEEARKVSVFYKIYNKYSFCKLRKRMEEQVQIKRRKMKTNYLMKLNETKKNKYIKFGIKNELTSISL